METSKERAGHTSVVRLQERLAAGGAAAARGWQDVPVGTEIKNTLRDGKVRATATRVEGGWRYKGKTYPSANALTKAACDELGIASQHPQYFWGIERARVRDRKAGSPAAVAAATGGKGGDGDRREAGEALAGALEALAGALEPLAAAAAELKNAAAALRAGRSRPSPEEVARARETLERAGAVVSSALH